MDDKKDTAHIDPNEEAVIEERVREETRARLRHARMLATDGGEGSHQGGFGAQGGQADFGNPENYD